MITKKLVKKVKNWLGEDGKKFFKQCIEEHGQIAAVYMEGGIPHCVHFVEGMRVRNFMRSTGLCEDWTAHDFDDNWVEVVREAIKE